MNVKSFKLLDTDLESLIFTKIENTYELKFRDEVLFYAVDTEEGFTFSKKIGKELNYFYIDALKVFLEMIEKCDGMVFEKYETYQKV